MVKPFPLKSREIVRNQANVLRDRVPGVSRETVLPREPVRHVFDGYEQWVRVEGIEHHAGMEPDGGTHLSGNSITAPDVKTPFAFAFSTTACMSS